MNGLYTWVASLTDSAAANAAITMALYAGFPMLLVVSLLVIAGILGRMILGRHFPFNGLLWGN